MKAVLGFLVALSLAVVSHASVDEQVIDRVETKDLGYVTGAEYEALMQKHAMQISSSIDCGKNGGNMWNISAPLAIPWALIVNIGKELWTIIENGQPTYQENYNVATALPVGTKCWNELSGWKKPVMKRFEYRFFAGTSYTSLKIAVVSVTGGKKAGKGAYIAYSSGFAEKMTNYGIKNKLSINVEVPAVFNDAESDDAEPVGAMLMSVRVANDSPLVDRIEGKMIHISGKGVIELSDEDVKP